MPAVQLFATCIVNHIFPDVGWAVVEVLERQGVAVQVPAGQTCCGQPAFNAGQVDEARAMARHTIDILGETEDALIVPSGSCGDMLVHHYVKLLADDPLYGPRAQALARRTYEFSQYLVDVLGVQEVGARYAGRVAYHPACHLLRGLQAKEQATRLLENIEGAQLVELPDAEACCGFGGLFALKMSDISGAMLRRKMDNIQASAADTLVACDMSCLMHIQGGLRRRDTSPRVLHLAQLLRSDAQ